MRPKTKDSTSQGTQTVSITRSTTNAAAAAAGGGGGTMSSSQQTSTPNGIISNGATRQQTTQISRMKLPSPMNEASLTTLIPISSSSSSSFALASTSQAAKDNESNLDEHRLQTYVTNAKLCRLVRRNPCLFNRNHLNYGKKHVLEKTWSRIAKDCDDNVSSIKERWRNIRAAYARSVNLYKTNTGPNRVKPYYLHKELSFLLKPMSSSRNRSKLSIQKNNQDDDDSEDDEDEDEDEEDQEENESTFEQKPTTSNLNNDQDNDDDDDDDHDDDKEIPLMSSKGDSNFLEITLGGSLASEDFNTSKDNELEFSSSSPKRRCIYFEKELDEQNAPQQQQQQHRSIATMTMNPCSEKNNNNNNNNSQLHLNNSHICDIRTLTSPSSLSSTMMRGMQTSMDFKATSIDCHSNNVNADRKFLEALLPDMNAMNLRQKIIFKRKIYQILEEVFDVATDFPNRNDLHQQQQQQQEHQQQQHQWHNHNEARDSTTTTTHSGSSKTPIITMLPPPSSSLSSSSLTTAATTTTTTTTPMPRLQRLPRLSFQASLTSRKTLPTLSYRASLVPQQQQQQRRTTTPPSDFKNELKDDDDDVDNADFVLVD